MTRNENYYQLLGIDRDANKSQIKKAYRRQAEKYHPDKIANRDEAEQDYALKRMKELNQAKDILLNTEKRNLYDSILEQQIADYQSFSYLNFTTITKLYRLQRQVKELKRKGFEYKKPRTLLRQAKIAVNEEDFQYALELINDAIEWIEMNYPEVIYIQKRSEEATQREIDKDLPSFDFFRKSYNSRSRTSSGELKKPVRKDRPSECPKCYNPIQEDQDYCYYCGYSF